MGGLFGVAAVASVPLLAATNASWLATGPGLAMALWLGLVATTLAYVSSSGLAGSASAVGLTLGGPADRGILRVAVLGETLTGAGGRRPRRAGGGIVVLATAVAVVAARARRLSSQAIRRPERRATRPRLSWPALPSSMDVILIPGFWLDASSWERVTPLIEEAVIACIR